MTRKDMIAEIIVGLASIPILFKIIDLLSKYDWFVENFWKAVGL